MAEFAIPSADGSVDEDWRAHRHHLIQRFDILVAQSHAAVTDRSANALRMVGAVQGVAVSHVEAVGAEDALVLALVRAVWRDHDVAPRHDLSTLDARLERPH